MYLYTVELPKALKSNGTANLVVETVQTHATYPWPEEASQKDGQSMKYESELFVLSPYKTAVQRTKFRYALQLCSQEIVVNVLFQVTKSSSALLLCPGRC